MYILNSLLFSHKTYTDPYENSSADHSRFRSEYPASRGMTTSPVGLSPHQRNHYHPDKKDQYRPATARGTRVDAVVERTARIGKPAPATRRFEAEAVPHIPFDR